MVIPIVLFAYARPDHLMQTLECLKKNNPPLIYAFSDGPRNTNSKDAVMRVRNILNEIDWCETILTERETNLGLGQSILTGVAEVLSRHEMAIIFEDDLVCVPETYEYLCAALKNYANNPEVMSVTGWTHSQVKPRDIDQQPYFDGRAECWVWGTWSRSWGDMTTTALDLMKQCREKRIDEYRYGADLPAMAEVELAQNIWAIRWLYKHILNQGLCLRPPWSLVNHIGFDIDGTNVKDANWMGQSLESPAPAIPEHWPDVFENPACPVIWKEKCGYKPSSISKLYKYFRSLASKLK